MIGPARVEATYTGDARCTFPYSPAVVEGIKAMVPSYCRSYDPDDRAWIISQPYVDRVIDLITAVFPDAQIDNRFVHYAGPGTKSRIGNEPYWYRPKSGHSPVLILPPTRAKA